jgi:DNA replication protein DnaC
VDFLVLDDFGLRPLSAQAVDDLYEIISQRYERLSIGITSNRALEEWAEVFGDSLLASAALDRLTHHVQMLTITGRSYRQLGRRKEAESTANQDVHRANSDVSGPSGSPRNSPPASTQTQI